MMSVYAAVFVLQDRHKVANMQIFLDLTLHLFWQKTQKTQKTHCFAVKKYYLQNIFIFVVVVLFSLPHQTQADNFFVLNFC